MLWIMIKELIQGPELISLLLACVLVLLDEDIDTTTVVSSVLVFVDEDIDTATVAG